MSGNIEILSRGRKCVKYQRGDLISDPKLPPSSAAKRDAVYRGVFESTGESVAVRELTWKYGCPDSKLYSALENWRLLSHPNILPLYAVVVGDGKLPTLILTELGAPRRELDLATARKKYKRTLAWNEQGLRLCLHVARALAYMHDTTRPMGPLLHGNLTTSNIIITEEFAVAKVGGIGLVAALGDLNQDFAAPELLDPAERSSLGVEKLLTAQSDIYSFGRVLQHTLLGYLPPRQGDQTVEYPSNVPGKLLKVIDTCLSTSPKERFMSAKNLVQELDILVNKKCARLSGLTVEGKEARRWQKNVNGFWHVMTCRPLVSLLVFAAGGAGIYFRMATDAKRSIRTPTPLHLPKWS